MDTAPTPMVASGHAPAPAKTPPQIGPVRVTLAHESELVVRGLEGMLARYTSRVRMLRPHSDGSPAAGADITLHDIFPRSGREASDALLLPAARRGAWVTYTWDPTPDRVWMSRAHGRGCIAKSLPAPALVAALEAVHRGQHVVECGLLDRQLRRQLATSPLTPREADVVFLITQGYDNSFIAQELSVSINSVKTYVRTAYQKMAVTSRSQAVLWGIRHGYLEPRGTHRWPASDELIG